MKKVESGAVKESPKRAKSSGFRSDAQSSGGSQNSDRRSGARGAPVESGGANSKRGFGKDYKDWLGKMVDSDSDSEVDSPDASAMIMGGRPSPEKGQQRDMHSAESSPEKQGRVSALSRSTVSVASSVADEEDEADRIQREFQERRKAAMQSSGAGSAVSAAPLMNRGHDSPTLEQRRREEQESANQRQQESAQKREEEERLFNIRQDEEIERQAQKRKEMLFQKQQDSEIERQAQRRQEMQEQRQQEEERQFQNRQEDEMKRQEQRRVDQQRLQQDHQQKLEATRLEEKKLELQKMEHQAVVASTQEAASASAAASAHQTAQLMQQQQQLASLQQRDLQSTHQLELDRQRQDFDRRIAELEEKLSKTQNALQEKQIENKSLESELQVAKKQVTDGTAQKDAHAEELRKVEEKRQQSVEQAQREKEALNERLREQMRDSSKRELELAQHGSVQAEQVSTKLHEELAAARESISEKQLETVELKSALRKAEEQLSQAQDKLKESEHLAAKHELASKEAETKADAAAKKVEETYVSVSREREKVDEKDEAMGALKQAVHSAESNLASAQDRAEKAIKEKAHMLMELEQLRRNTGEMRTTNLKAQAGEEAAKSELTRIRTVEMAEMEAARHRLMKEVGELSANLAEIQAETALKDSRLRIEQEEASRQHSALRVQQQALEDRERQQRRQQGEKESSVRELTRKVAELESTNSGLSKELQAHSESHASKLRLVEEAREEALYESRRTKERADQADGYRKREVERVREKQRELEEMKEEQEALQARLEEAEARERRAPAEHRATKLENEQMRTKLMQREKELGEAKVAYEREVGKLQTEISRQLPQLAAAAVKRAQEEWQSRCNLQLSSVRDELGQRLNAEQQRSTALQTTLQNKESATSDELGTMRIQMEQLMASKRGLEDEADVLRGQLRRGAGMGMGGGMGGGMGMQLSTLNQSQNQSFGAGGNPNNQSINLMQQQMSMLQQQMQSVLETSQASHVSQSSVQLTNPPPMPPTHHSSLNVSSMHMSNQNANPNATMNTTMNTSAGVVATTSAAAGVDELSDADFEERLRSIRARAPQRQRDVNGRQHGLGLGQEQVMVFDALGRIGKPVHEQSRRSRDGSFAALSPGRAGGVGAGTGRNPLDEVSVNMSQQHQPLNQSGTGLNDSSSNWYGSNYWKAKYGRQAQSQGLS
jgi:hypothetical protein